uniref:Putative secreted peptide n=1 Tax=Anopheles braziliensis TaxID=58242 RepID=A0A2M3ZRZ9_9DIPT
MCCWFLRTTIRPQSVLSVPVPLLRPPSPVRSFWDDLRQHRAQQSLVLLRQRRRLLHHPHVHRNGFRNHNPLSPSRRCHSRRSRPQGVRWMLGKSESPVTKRGTSSTAST